MKTTVTERPVKINFKSQKDIVKENRIRRQAVLLAFDQIKEAQEQVAASLENK